MSDLNRKQAQQLLATIHNEFDRSLQRLIILQEAYEKNGNEREAAVCKAVIVSIVESQNVVDSLKEVV